jgi:hypothetical protein
MLTPQFGTCTAQVYLVSLAWIRFERAPDRIEKKRCETYYQTRQALCVPHNNVKWHDQDTDHQPSHRSRTANDCGCFVDIWISLHSKRPHTYRLHTASDRPGTTLLVGQHLQIREASPSLDLSRRNSDFGKDHPPMMAHGAYDDGELEISLAPSANRRANNKPPDASTRQASDENDHRSVEPVPQKKAEQRIGAYHIIRTLGEGSFGKVKLATHRITQQQVALKIIARKKLISRDMAGRVEREIEYLQLLRHPHIIKL